MCDFDRAYALKTISCIHSENSTVMAKKSTSANAAIRTQPPPQIVRFELKIGQEIGAGEHGKVFSGTYRGIIVAIKCALSDETTSRHESAEKALAHEAEVLTSLPRHPHIVSCLGTVSDDEGVAVVFEHVSKTTAAALFSTRANERAKHTMVRLCSLFIIVLLCRARLHAGVLT